MDPRRDTRSQADRILGNPPAPSRADRAQANRADAARKLRDAGRKLAHDYQVEAAVQQGQPGFPHTGHVVASIATVGLWTPIYWLAWRRSGQRRYQRDRRAQLRRDGIGRGAA